MIDRETLLLFLVLLVGLTLIFTILIKAALERVGIPPLVGYLILGIGMGLLNSQVYFLSLPVREVLAFLGELGIISLLFRVGLESNLAGLIRQLPRASFIFLGNLSFSGILGFFAASKLLQLPLIPSLFISIALMATSVGISVSVWQEAKALNTENGELLIDIAEMDDIAAIAIMSLFFAMIPVLNGNVEANIVPVFLQTIIPFLTKVVVFGVSCLIMFRYLERPMTQWFERLEPAPDPMIMVVGTAFIIAALAGLMGFSVAVGAFFAGLVFCRDPDAINLDASFSTLYEFFVPFFFIHIGLQLEIVSFAGSLNLVIVLLIVAVLGKVIGTGLPAVLTTGKASALLLSISMIPRAEIAMVILERGRQLGNWAVSPQIFTSMILVSAITCIASPLLLRPLLQKSVQ
ncbi:Kef-type K+ transport system, membrane component [Xenococcus sp. PCC 7305]|uniref:cation:proton antiporter n=1 Tax=Xenococcus sp. PCC 7305 TaxID=102125 RepID=UPI0002ABE9A3|nr:cation:proton antiporter [Xenococcus sp. PCC 7305]ELS00778.1 Kef-type K+ transport system, membrane component [Xenococcus sp. PCC 7305]